MGAEEYAFRDRPPTDAEFERLRLTLSIYRDGSGAQVINGETYPNWRDFERAVASVFNGVAQENKWIFDVLIPVTDGLPYGLSCKTKAGQRDHVYMEMANAPASFLSRLAELAIDPKEDPQRAGPEVIRVIQGWHQGVAGTVDVARSSYVTLTHDKSWETFQLAWYPLDLGNPDELLWKLSQSGRCLSAYQNERKIWDWYPWSGGQLKFYAPFDWARWLSEPFTLEDPPIESPASKAQRYWPGRWPAA